MGRMGFLYFIVAVVGFIYASLNGFGPPVFESYIQRHQCENEDVTDVFPSRHSHCECTGPVITVKGNREIPDAPRRQVCLGASVKSEQVDGVIIDLTIDPEGASVAVDGNHVSDDEGQAHRMIRLARQFEIRNGKVFASNDSPIEIKVEKVSFKTKVVNIPFSPTPEPISVKLDL